MTTMENFTSNQQSELTVGGRIGAVKQLAASVLSLVDEMRDLQHTDRHTSVNLQNEVLRYEIELIEKALRVTGEHQRRAAELLSIRPSTLNAKIKRYHIRLSSNERVTTAD
jgi:DNA-binding NtrC family response regulator